MTARNPRLGYGLVILAAILFGLNAGVSRVPLRSGMPTDTFTTLRITGAFVVLVVIAAIFDRSALRRPRGRAFVLISALGLIGVTGVQWTYNIAIDRLPLGIALLLEYLAPVLIVLWVRFVRKEPVRDRMWIAIALALAGLALVAQVWDGLTLDGLGVAMALGAAVCFAFYFLLGEHNVGTEDPLQVIVWAFAAATAAMNLVQPVWTVDTLGVDASLLGRLADHSAPAWIAMAWVVMLGTVVPFFLLLLALQHLPATVVPVVAMLEPVIATLVGWAWFAESLSVMQLGGMVILLGGILLAQTSRSMHTTLPPP